MKAIFLSAILLLLLQTAQAQTSYTWNGSLSSAWAIPGNWTPAGIPGTTDDVKIVTASNLCRLAANTTINNITLTSGILDLDGFTLTANGSTATFSSGTVQNGSIAVSSAVTTTFGTGTVTLNCTVTISTATVSIRNTTFQGTVSITKTGSTGDSNNGNNIFNGVSTITNAGSGSLILAATGADKFYNTATFNNSGSNTLHVAYNSSNNIFNGPATFNNTSGAPIYVGWYSAGVAFNNDIVVSSVGGNGVQFCGGNATASATIAAGHTISIGGTGFSSGTLSLRQFTQSGTAPVNLALSGTAELRFGPTSSFGGAVTVNSPNIYAASTVFNSAAVLTKTDGTFSNPSSGGNTFNAGLTINYTSTNGTGYWSFGYGAPDVYNGDVYSNNNSLDRIIFGHNSTNNQFNGNLIVTQTGSSRGTSLTWNNGSTSVMAAGKTISIGSAGFSVGYFYVQGLTQNGNTPVNIITTGSSSVYFGDGNTYNPSVIGGNCTVSAPDIYVRGTTFNSDVFITKTGGVSNHNNGRQNIFNGNLTIEQQSSTGYFMLGYNSNDLFNDDITVTSTGSGGIYLGYPSGTGTPTLAAGKTILTGGAGFSDGFLSLNTFTQLGSAPIHLAFNGTNTTLRFARNSVIGGALTASSPNIYFDGCTFNGTVDATKTGASSNSSVGGNTFNQRCAITNNGSSYLLLGNSVPDIWNDDVIFSDNGSDRLLPCWASAGNQFNGNIYVNTSGSATGINFCGGNNTATATLAAGKTIQAGTTGLNAGYLILRQFTQLGNAPINLVLSNTATSLQFGPSSSLGGNVTSSSPGLLFNGCTFSGTVNATKTGNNNDAGSGNNIFNNNTSITNAGSGYLMLGNGNADQFNSAATFNNTGSNNIYVAYNSSNNIFGGATTFNNNPVGNNSILVSSYSVGTVFNDNIIVTSTGGQGVQFCTGNATASAALSAGKTISIGGAGFSSGTLLLRQFTQSGATAQHLSLTGSAALTFGPSSSFGGNITSSSPGLYFHGCTFSGMVNSVKTGATNDGSNGNNIFNGNTTISNSGSGYVLLGNGSADQFNAAVTFNNTGSSNIYVAYNSSNNIFGSTAIFNNTPLNNTAIYVSSYSAGTVFNDNIIVSSTNGQGVQFCSGNTTASANLSAGKTISVGGAGFSSGTLLLKQFTQTGSTAQNISLTGSGILTFGPSSAFGGNLTSSSPSLFFNGCIFSGVVNATKTGATGDASSGNNTFNNKAYFINNGTGQLLMTNSYGDTYNDDVSFTKGNTGLVYPNYNQSSNYAGNVTISSTTAITLGAGSGTAIFNGSASQQISVTAGTPTPIFTRLTINNSGSGVNLNNTSINVSQNLVLTSGLLKTTTGYILTMLNNATVAAGTALSTSYVNGPMRYQKSSSGSTTLNFPVGNGSDCRPVSLTVNHTNGTLYTYQTQLFNASAAALGYTLPSTVTSASTVHYYTIGRTDASGNNQPVAGLSGNQTIQIFFGANDLVTDGSNITIVKNTYTATTSWVDIGGTGGAPYAGGINLTGSITSTSAPTVFNSFSTFAIGFRVTSILPVTFTDFTAKVNYNFVDLTWTTATEINNDFFSIEKSKDGVTFELLQNVSTKAANGNSQVNLYYTAQDRNPYNGRSYYRLKQTDFDGKYVYSKIVTVSFDKKQTVSIYPNPSVGSIYIGGLEGNNASAEWYDVSGRKVLTQSSAIQNGIVKFDVRLSDGIYLLKYRTEKIAPQAQQIIIRK